MHIEAKLAALGLTLPAPTQVPPGIRLPFAPARVVGKRVVLSGHGPLAADGSLAQPLGKVGVDVTPEQAYAAARLTALAMIASLKRAIGDLDRVSAWVRVFGMVNAAPDFAMHPAVINGCSDLILELWGPEVGAHARSAVGMGSLPFAMPVEIEGEVAID